MTTTNRTHMSSLNGEFGAFVEGRGSVCSDGLLARLDLAIPSDLAPVDASELVGAAARLGLRSVLVDATLANVTRAALPRTSEVRVACSEVAGWPGNSLLMHAGERLNGRTIDELDIPVDASLLGDAAWIAGQLRRVAVLCHAHGALANVVVPARGLTASVLQELVSGLVRASINAVTLRVASGCVPVELVAAAVAEAAGHIEVRVDAPELALPEAERLLDLGVASLVVMPEQLEACLEEPVSTRAEAPSHARAATASSLAA